MFKKSINFVKVTKRIQCQYHHSEFGSTFYSSLTFTPKNSPFLRLQNLLRLLLISTCFFRDENNNITAKLHEKCDAFGFHIVNFPSKSSNIPSAPAHGVYASQLIHCAHCFSNYSAFYHATGVTRFLSQGYKVNCLCNTLKKF